MTPFAPSRSRGSLAIAALSVATAIWLAAQLYVGLTVNHGPWPVVGYGMASQSEPTFVVPHVDARLADGRRVAIEPRDLDLTSDQFRRYVLRKIVDDRGAALEGGTARLGRLVGVWSLSQGSRVVGATVVLEVHPLPEGRPTRRAVLDWDGA